MVPLVVPMNETLTRLSASPETATIPEACVASMAFTPSEIPMPGRMSGVAGGVVSTL